MPCYIARVTPGRPKPQSRFESAEPSHSSTLPAPIGNAEAAHKSDRKDIRLIRSLTASLILAGVLITPIAAVAGTPVTATIIVSGLQQTTVTTQADDVGALLEEQGIHLGPSDQVTPALSARVPEDGVVRIDRVITWDKTESRKIASAVVERPDYALAPDATKVVSAGRSGVRVVTVRYTQRGDDVTKQVVSSRIVQTMRPHVVAVGLGEYAAFQRFDRNALDRTSRMAGGVMQMVATAYTAGCSGCSGVTALGYRAGHGIVAVDPRVIPLGARLYIPGYGYAIAGDTGGDIRGNRIDLGFNSERDAMMFGRRAITVYRIK